MDKAVSPCFKKIDCIRLFVSDLDKGLHFYLEKMGLELAWRTDREAGLRMSQADTEIVLQQETSGIEVDFLVESVENAVDRFVAAGGRVAKGPFEIPVGRCVVVTDPWGNEMVLLDLSKGTYKTDQSGTVIDIESPGAG